MQNISKNHFVKNSSSVTQRFLCDIEKLSTADYPVLITGEIGSGKQVAAKSIHAKSKRKDQPFVSVSCAEISSYAHIELFGVEANFFTEIPHGKIGILEQARNGSIFLDEIDSLSLQQQAILLRFLQDKTIVRLGGIEPITLNVRVFAAMQINSEYVAKNGQFNKTLFHHLSVLSLYVPPLRERYDEIKPLALEFLQEYNTDYQSVVSGFKDEALFAMMAYMWPGNIRELRNRVKKAIAIANDNWITPENLGFCKYYSSSYEQALEAANCETEKSLVQFTLKRFNRSLEKVAQVLGISQDALNQLLKKHRIKSG